MNTALMAKIDILLNLINFAKDMSAIKSDLAKIGFNSESELVTITKNTIANILIDKEISYELLEEWANLIECREDIGYEDGILQEIIFELANPCLYGEIDEEKICMILDEIKYGRSDSNDTRKNIDIVGERAILLMALGSLQALEHKAITIDESKEFVFTLYLNALGKK